MRTTRLVAVLVGLAAILAITADASAMYNPATGTWLQRDPGPGGMTAPPRTSNFAYGRASSFLRRDPAGQYSDGMNLYLYSRGSPAGASDPFGLQAENEQRCDCGPDVTEWFLHEMGNQAAFLSNMMYVLRQGPSARPGADLSYYWDFAKTSMEMSTGREYKTKSCWATGEKDDEQGNCHGSVTLCGKCTRMKNLGNIIFGYAGHWALPPAVLDAGFNLLAEGAPNKRQIAGYSAGNLLYSDAPIQSTAAACADINRFTDQQYWHGNAKKDFNSWQSCSLCKEKFDGPHYVTDQDVQDSQDSRTSVERSRGR